MIFYALAFYITRLFVPTGLSAFHPYPLDGLPVEYFIAPLVALMLTFLLFRLKGQQKRFVMAGLLFFLFSIAIVLELIPLGVQVVKERYVYLPSIGIYFAFAVLMLFLFVGKYKRLPLAITLLLVVFFTTITVSRAVKWKDSLSLWNNVLDRDPHISAALINRGNAWQDFGDPNKAITDYSVAIKVEPGAADAYLNRGLAYNRMGNTTKALEDLDQAIVLGVRDSETYNIRGLLRASGGMFQEAISDFHKASETDPDNINAWINLGLMYANTANYESAINALSEAISRDDHSAKAYYWRGMAQLQLKNYNAACEDMKSAVTNGWTQDQVPEFCR
jgi:tetratricopeptide (TPR) repeat protein